MNKVAANLRQLIRARGISENQLSRHTDVAQPTIHRILAGHTADPRDGTLRPLAAWFGVTVEQLRTELPDMDVGGPEKGQYRIKEAASVAVRERPHDVGIAEVTARLTATEGKPKVELIATGERIVYNAAWFPTQDAVPADVRVFRVSGDSMERTLFDGDRVTVNLADTRIADGRVHVLAIGGPEPDLKIKRLFKTSDGRVRVVSDHPDKSLYPDELLGAEELASVLVLGRVIERSGAGGL